MVGQYIEPMPWTDFAHAPSQCEVCRQWCGAALCADCIARFAAPVSRCARCALRLGVPAPACGACLREPPPFEHCHCVADYGFPWDRLIAAFKFEGRVELAAPLARCLHAAVSRDHEVPVGLVLPVPLSPRRLAERGYNQAWELARRLAALARRPSRADLLQRPFETAHQAGLGRGERQRNLRGAFMVDPRQRHTLQGQRVMLVDDVLTTGATASEATAALLRAGAAAVDLWVIARTPDAESGD